MSSVAVAILNWNGLQHLKTFLPSVVQYSTEASVYLIDNGSTDASVEWVRAHYPLVKTVELNRNYGFCEGYNLGLASLEEKYFILLNSDVEVTPQWLEPLLQLMESDSSIAACQPKLLDFKRKNYFEYAGGAGGFLDYLGTPFCKGRILQTLEEDQGQYDVPCPIHWATGAALMIRSNLFKQVGGFDKRFFAHMEEIDLCWRLRILGLQIYSCPQSIVFHLGGGTLNTGSPQKTFFNVKNNLLMLSKNLPRRKRPFVLIQKLVLDGLASMFFLLQGKWRGALAIIKGHWAFYLSPKPDEIHDSQETGKSKAYNTHLPSSIVKQYYLRNMNRFTELPSMN